MTLSGDKTLSTPKQPTFYATVPVFRKLKDEDLTKLLQVIPPASTVSERRARAVKKFYASLRFPDESMDIPFNE